MNDMLNSKGNKINFLNNLPYSDQYKKLAEKWSKLPVYSNENINKFMNLLNSKQVILLSSGTGSGKTVIIPKLLLKNIIDKNISGKIAITNPKILTTFSNAEYGALTLDVTLGEEVGFKYKGAPKHSVGDKTRLVYLTDGLLLTMISNEDKYLKDYVGVVIDEAHERHIQIDLLLKLLKEIVLHRKDFKLVIMSATINAKVFSDYFNVKDINYGEIDISGSSNYPIKQNWLEKDINKKEYLNVAINRCNEILKLEEENNDIIIFVPIQKDTINGCNKITETNKHLLCVEVFAKMSSQNRELAISKDKYKQSGYDKKVIFATNVAESSITFDGLIYVIDTGLELINQFDSLNNMNIVNIDYTTQSQIIQRIGRTGRTSPGIAYHLYTQKKFNSLEKYPKPGILVMDLTDYALSLIYYATTINNFIKLTNDLITKPTKIQLDFVLHKLEFNKCLKLNNNNGVLSRVGINILKFKSTELMSALAIIMSYYLNCQYEIMVIMAMIDVTDNKLDTLFIYDNQMKYIKYFNKYSYPNSDHLTLLNIYMELYKKNIHQYLNIDIFKKIDKQVKEYKHFARSINKKNYKYMNKKYNLITIDPYEDNINNILYVLGKSHLYNLIRYNNTVNFKKNTTANLEFLRITVTNKNNYEYSIFHSLINRFDRKVFNIITKIPNFIKIK
uniref:Helicase ATP-binding domain-containing protein n=1 Tax=viral metagenome TaxID=1070528 RepID=A0A6C0ECL4_9ZZZZ